jgi:propanol-preferring alcohol dehydrogenase
MQVVLLPGEREVVVTERSDPEPGPGEVLVALRAAGICGSDLHLYRASREARQAHQHIVPGHEPCGVIVELGPGVTNWRVGERVVVNVPTGCGRCEFCLQGWTVSCKDRGKRGITIPGSDADFLVAPANTLLSLPDELSYIAGMLCACNVGTAYQAMQRVNVSGRDFMVVFGAGPVGCSVMMLGQALNAQVVMVDISTERLKFAKDLGANHTLNPTDTDIVAAVAELTKGRGADVAIDTSGAPAAQATMLEVLGYWGRAAFVGMQPGELSVRPNKIIERQLVVIGSAYWPLGIFQQMARFIINHQISIERIVSYQMRLSDAVEGFRIADAADTGKVAFVWPD